jgi:phosphoribosylformylglycinamidine (FGAM) synthase-like amidotransferase family enzyme
MAVTVKNLYEYDPNFDYKKIVKLVGRTNFKQTDTIDLKKVEGLGDKKLTTYVADKEGKSYINTIYDENLQAQVAKDTNTTLSNQQNQQNSDPMSMDGSVWNIARNKENNFA